jgi:hypothetical protein
MYLLNAVTSPVTIKAIHVFNQYLTSSILKHYTNILTIIINTVTKITFI